LFNNRIYGLTKGQYSPTSQLGTVTKSSPKGSLDMPFDPVGLAIGAEAPFVGRAVDTDRAGLADVLAQAARHRGAALVEVLQNCMIFNNGAWDHLKGPNADRSLIRLVDGQPITWAGGSKCLIRDSYGDLVPADTAYVPASRILVHEASHPDPSLAFGVSRLDRLGLTPVGVFRDVARPTYDDQVRDQVTWIGDRAERQDALQALFTGPDPWTID
jgi:2-oxoglutarate ferredoxin oxidoreductase subunit beta